MKLKQHANCERPAARSIHQSLALLSPACIAAMSERPVNEDWVTVGGTTTQIADLEEVLPQLVAALQQEVISKRPEWWHDAPWALHHLTRAIKSQSISSALLRSLTSKCYSHLMQHYRKTSSQARILVQPRVLDWLNSQLPSHSCALPVKNNGISSPPEKGDMPYVDIFFCCRCNQEFCSKDTLQKHQVVCDGDLPLSMPSTPPASEAASPIHPTVVFDDPSSSGGVSNMMCLSSAVSRKNFIAGLDLVPVHRARKIRQARRRNTECEAIDLEEPQTPISPLTPRTPKLLISQLSRDASAGGSPVASSRRRLSYLLPSLEKPEDIEKVEGKDHDDDSAESSTEDTDEPKMHKKTLFSIDVTSGLGQRVLKHMTAESHVPVISDSEQFCRTPIKEKYRDRLRYRQLSYPITWKLTGKRLRQQSHFHMYNFTRAQKFEFMEKMRTGLSWQFRHLLHCVKRCSVVVKGLSSKTLHKWKPSLNKVTVSLRQLTEEEVQLWTRPKVTEPKTSKFPFSTSLSALSFQHRQGNSALKCKTLPFHAISDSEKDRAAQRRWKISTSPLVQKSQPGTINGWPESCGLFGRNIAHRESSETDNSFPTLLSILSSKPVDFKIPCSNGAGDSSSVDLKKPLKIEIPSSVMGLGPPLRKSSRSSPLDDSFSVMTVSSSDEENIKNATCCLLCAERNKCHCSPSKTPSISTNPSSALPVPTSKLSSSSITPFPPDLPSVSTTPVASVSQISFSPPHLSPVSQLGWFSPQSTVSHARLSSGSRAQSPKVSPITLCRTSPEPSEFHVNGQNPVNSSPNGSAVRSYRVVRNGEENVTNNCRKTSSSSGLFQPLPLVRSPSVSSSSKESQAGEDKKSASRLTRYRDKYRKALSGEASKAESEWTIPRKEESSTLCITPMSSCSVRSSQNGFLQDANCSAASDRDRNNSFSDRFQKVKERKQNIGHNLCVQNISDGFHVAEERTKNCLETCTHLDCSKRSSRRLSSNINNSGWTARNDGFLCRPLTDVENTSSSDCLEENGHKSTPWSGSPALQYNMGNTLDNLFVVSGEEENGNESFPAFGRSRCSSDLAHSNGSGFSLNQNPFLSKIQTPLFSSSVLDQARRQWSPPCKSPSSEGGVLVSGSQVRFSNNPPQTTGLNLDTTVVPHSSKIEPVSQAGRLQCVVSQDSVVRTKPCFFVNPSSPGHVGLQTPVRKQLSAMQMLSVLESVKAFSPPKSKVKSPKDARHRKKCDHGFEQITTRGFGYHTRASESATSVISRKRTRYVE